MAKVMIVDDEDVLLTMISLLVEELGHEPITATNGKEALEILDGEADLPAVIFSDVMMPIIGGVELVNRIRSDPRLSGIPIVLMSAGVSPSVGAVADQFIRKPFDLTAIEEVIQFYADGGQ
jgi:two-component system, sensor histidine kinase and response regulator